MGRIIRLVRGAENLPHGGEFQGFNGDCGEYAEACAAHIANSLPLTPEFLNMIVNRDIARGWAGANGVETLNDICLDLGIFGITYQLHPNPVPNWQQLIQENAGIRPVLVEYANAQALTGDERGVHYHFNLIVGLCDDGNVVACDGDNATTRQTGALVQYSQTNLADAQVYGLIVINLAEGHVAYTKNADGSLTFANGVKLAPTSGGVIHYVETHNVQENALSPEVYYKAGHSFTPFTMGLIVTWDTVNEVQDTFGGEVLNEIWVALETTRKNLAALQGEESGETEVSNPVPESTPSSTTPPQPAPQPLATPVPATQTTVQPAQVNPAPLDVTTVLTLIQSALSAVESAEENLRTAEQLLGATPPTD